MNCVSKPTQTWWKNEIEEHFECRIYKHIYKISVFSGQGLAKAISHELTWVLQFIKTSRNYWNCDGLCCLKYWDWLEAHLYIVTFCNVVSQKNDKKTIFTLLAFSQIMWGASNTSRHLLPCPYDHSPYGHSVKPRRFSHCIIIAGKFYDFFSVQFSFFVVGGFIAFK